MGVGLTMHEEYAMLIYYGYSLDFLMITLVSLIVLTGAMFIFLREKIGSTTRLQDTTVINFQEIVHSTRLL